jgi:hypothetical protein
MLHWNLARCVLEPCIESDLKLFLGASDESRGFSKMGTQLQKLL